MHTADLTTVMCKLSLNLGASTSWNRPVQGLLNQRPSSTFEIFGKFSVVVIWTATPLFQPFLIAKGPLINKTVSTAFQFRILHKGFTDYFLLQFHISRFQNSRASFHSRCQKTEASRAASSTSSTFTFF